MQNRQNKILELVQSEKKVEVSRLSDLLGVSQVTIRKDLDALESRGMIRREHGYAALNDSDDLTSRLAWHYEAKEEIARLALEEVQDEDIVMIENGSCCALVARAIAENRSNITIITNSAFIAEYIRKSGHPKIILLGGEYQPESQCNVGPITIKNAQNFFVDKFFIGTDGYRPNQGFTGKNYMRCETVKEMAKQADKVIIVTESDKFDRNGYVSLLRAQDVYEVITDSGLDDSIRKHLEEENIIVKTA